jgi:hypothetical protein
MAEIYRTPQDWAALRKAEPAYARSSDEPAFLDLAAKLIEMIGDGSITRQQQQTSAQYVKAKEDALKAVAESKRELADHQKHKDEHAALIKASEDAFNKRCSERERDLALREAEMNKRDAQSKAHAEAVASKKLQLEKFDELLRGALR